MIQRILSKFAFVNEDICRKQTVNELSWFTARESNTYHEDLSPGKPQSARFSQKDCLSQIQNPNQLWSNNGIGYDISQNKDRTTSFIAQNHIKRKLDGVLYQVSRRIYCLFNQGLEITSFEFADSLLKEITALTTYIEEHSSRLVLQ